MGVVSQRFSRCRGQAVDFQHAHVLAVPLERLDLLGPFVVETARRTAEPDTDGWFRCRLPVEAGDFGLRELMRLGDEIEVIGPPALRESLAAILTAMVRRHA